MSIKNLGQVIFSTGQKEELMTAALNKRSGIIIIFGEPGAGKTTTLEIIMRQVELKDRHLIEVCEELEFVSEKRDQVILNKSVDDDIPVDISRRNMWKLCVKMSPQIIVWQELREKVDFDAAFEVSAIGHFVICGLNARSKNQVIERLLNSVPLPVLRTRPLMLVQVKRIDLMTSAAEIIHLDFETIAA